MLCRDIIVLSGVLVFLTGCSGGENAQPTTAPPTPSLAQQAVMKASNSGASDGFGGSVALAGNTFAVGAPFEDSAATGINGNQNDDGAGDSGAVYVFTKINGVWTQQAYVKASNAGGTDGFGGPIALDGDTLLVGASSEDSSATGINGNQNDESAFNSGAAYVFTRTNGAWSQQAYVKASNTERGDSFGGSVAIAANTMAIGARFEDSSAIGINGNEADNGARDSGAAYVFTRTNGAWTQEAYVKASNTETDDRFGERVALDGNTLVIGAPGEDSSATGINGNEADNGASDSGAVYVFTRTNGAWTQQAYVKASNTGAGDRFGERVVLDGNTLVVGAPSKDSNSGAVYVFTRVNGVWSQQASFKASNTEAGDSFGSRMGLAGNTLVVGVSGEDSSATGINDNDKQGDNSAIDSGAAYVFTRTNGVWTQQSYVKASNTGAGDSFGNSVAWDGSHLVVGASGKDSKSGAVYVMQ